MVSPSIEENHVVESSAKKCGFNQGLKSKSLRGPNSPPQQNLMRYALQSRELSISLDHEEKIEARGHAIPQIAFPQLRTLSYHQANKRSFNSVMPSSVVDDA